MRRPERDARRPTNARFRAISEFSSAAPERVSEPGEETDGRLDGGSVRQSSGREMHAAQQFFLGHRLTEKVIRAS